MRKDIPSDWLYPSSLEQASKVQSELSHYVSTKDDFQLITSIAGTDVSNHLNDPEQIIHAAAVLLDPKSLVLKEEFFVKQKQIFPYIPGFLGFREAPALVEAFKGLSSIPEIILVDGHGISHPRGLGIASHLGVLLDIPTIGVAKSILVGKPSGELGPEVGSQVPLIWKGRQIAIVIRTKLRCNPLIISTGHRISLETAVQLVLQSSKGYRLPEPTRQAHLAANRCRTGASC